MDKTKWIIVLLISLFMCWCTAKQPDATTMILKEREKSKNIPTQFIDSNQILVSWNKR